MTTITILPEKADSYRALAGDKESTGHTAGEALDALTSQLAEDESGTLIIVQNHKVDEFFSAAQQERLTELMQLRQAQTLSPEEEQELKSLVETELDGARRRTERKIRQRLHGELVSGLIEREIELMALFSVEGLTSKEFAVLSDEDMDKIRHEVKKMRANIRRRIRQNLSQELKRKNG